jgi:hypothetical protein
LLQINREAQSDVVAFQTGVPNQNRISQSALAKQMQLVFARSKINWPEVFRGDFAVHGHGESGGNERPSQNVGAPRLSGH